jgi:hypothetical protein
MAAAKTQRSSGTLTQTPSGIEVAYQEKPKRGYRVRAPLAVTSAIDSKDQDEYGPWQDVVSVTTALNVIHKPALTWWGMQIGIDGVVALVDRGLMQVCQTQEGGLALATLRLNDQGKRAWLAASGDRKFTEDLLTQEKLTTNHVRDKAGDRGNSVHAALENWLADRTIPVPELYPEHEQGYIRGLLKFLTDIGEVKTADAEITVASVRDGFAGRYDMSAVLKKCNLVQSPYWETPTGQPREEVRYDLPAGRYLFDLKTSKGVYETHLLQLEAYEAASVECGYPATKARICVRVSPDGTYSAVKSNATYDQFLAVLGCYKAMEQLKKTEAA